VSVTREVYTPPTGIAATWRMATDVWQAPVWMPQGASVWWLNWTWPYRPVGGVHARGPRKKNWARECSRYRCRLVHQLVCLIFTEQTGPLSRHELADALASPNRQMFYLMRCWARGPLFGCKTTTDRTTGQYTRHGMILVQLGVALSHLRRFALRVRKRPASGPTCARWAARLRFVWTAPATGARR